MGFFKLVVILIALVVILGMVLKYLAKQKALEVKMHKSDNSVTKKHIGAERGKHRDSFQADISKARGGAIAESTSAVLNSQAAVTAANRAMDIADVYSGAYEVRAVTDATVGVANKVTKAIPVKDEVINSNQLKSIDFGGPLLLEEDDL